MYDEGRGALALAPSATTNPRPRPPETFALGERGFRPPRALGLFLCEE